MMKIKIDPLLVIPIALLLILPLAQSPEKDTGSTVMNASVGNVVSLTVSPAITRGILYGSINAGTNNNMAENDTTSSAYTNCTEYYIANGASSTGDINLWHYAPDMDREGNPDYILIGNVTHEANQTANGVNVNITATTDGSVQMTTSYSRIGGASAPCDNLAAGSECYIAYWLDVPSGIPDGVYNTTYYYCGNLTVGSAAC